MSQINTVYIQSSAIFGTRLQGIAEMPITPWKMPRPEALRLTPKVHNVLWYTSGFT